MVNLPFGGFCPRYGDPSTGTGQIKTTDRLVAQSGEGMDVIHPAPGTGRPSGGRALLDAVAISKDFPGTRALDAVDLDVRPGEIHGLCGGNGSGKSTLIKILAGVQHAELGGTIRVGDVEVRADHVTPAFAHEAGVRVVHQDLGVFPDLSVAENMALGVERFPTGFGGRIRWAELRRRSVDLIERFDIRAKPETLMRGLNRATQTEVAIARALQGSAAGRPGLLILDEPTTALPAAEVESLLESLRRYASMGQSILFVSHRLDEVLRLTERVTILRDGRKAGTWNTRGLDEDGLITAILGRALEHVTPATRVRQTGEPVLELREVRAGPLRSASLRVDRGEVVGIAGLLGSGRTSLLRAVFGDLPVESGEILVKGDVVKFRNASDAVDAGVALVPEDRATDAAFADLPLAMNLSVTVLGRYWKGGRMRERRMRTDATDLMRAHGIKAPASTVPFNVLSGGNQQKGVLARWLRREPDLLLLDEPTQGVDVGARADIYRVIREAAAAGMAVLVVTSDVEELAHLADRAVILRSGRTVAEVEDADLEAHRLTALIHQGEMPRVDAD